MVTSTSEKAPYRTTVTDGTSFLSADTTVEHGGQGGAFRPHDLLCAALASCLNMTVRMILERRGLAYETVRVQVDLDRSDPIAPVFRYDMEITGDIDPRIKQEILRKAANCPVHKTLAQPLSFQAMAPKTH